MAIEDTTTTRIIGNPEEVFAIPEEAGGAKRDIAQTCIARAQATIELLIASDGDNNFLPDHSSVMNGLSAVAGWLEMAQTALSGPAKHDGV